MPIIDPIHDPLDIIIMAGQSNMEGNGLGKADREWLPDSDILIMNGKLSTRVEKKPYGNAYLVVDYSNEYNIDVAKERIDGGKSKHCLTYTFAELYKANRLKKGRKILLVQTSVGGTGFAKGHWGLSDPLFLRMLDMTREALSMNKENRIVAMLWHQGEHDAYEGETMKPSELEENYKNNLRALISRTRAEFGNVPFIAAGFTRCWIAEYPEHNAAVLNATDEICQSLDNATFIKDTLDLSVNDELVGDGDTVHFSRPALITLGERYYKAFSKISD